MSPFFQKQKSFQEEKDLLKNKPASRKAREICRQGVFENAYLEMKDLGLMKYEISKTEKFFAEELAMLYSLSKKDLEMLTILRLFDERTFYHSIDTHVTAKKKIQKKIEENLSFIDLIQSEGITNDQFKRACLFHDIGKISIPNFLLDSHYTDENWAQAFAHMPKWKIYWTVMRNKLNIPKKLLDDPESLMEYLLKKRIRAVKFVPIKMLFSKKQVRDLGQRGFYDGMSLWNIIQKHEKESEKILEFMGYSVEAKIAGSHHNYEKASKETKKETPNYLIKQEGFSADILHLADIQEALKSNRPYLSQRPVLRTLAFMIDDARKGLVDVRITYLWVKDELGRIDVDYLKSVTSNEKNNLDYKNLKDRKEELEFIQEFLSDAKYIMENSPFSILEKPQHLLS